MANSTRDGHRRDRQLEGRRQPFGNGGRDRLIRAKRRPEIAGGEPLQKAAVLDVERPVEPEPSAQLGDVLRRRAVAEHRLHRIAGHEMDEREDERRDAEENGNR